MTQSWTRIGFIHGLDWVDLWEKLHGLDWIGSDDRQLPRKWNFQRLKAGLVKQTLTVF